MKETRTTRNLSFRRISASLILAGFVIILAVLGYHSWSLHEFQKNFSNPETTHVSAPASYGIPTAGITTQMQNAIVDGRQRNITMSPVEADLVQSYSEVDQAVYDELDQMYDEIAMMNTTPRLTYITYDKVKSLYLTNPDAYDDRCAEVEASYGMNQKMYISEWLVNVRQNPGTEFDVVTTLPAGTEVTVECLAYDVDGEQWAQIGDDQFIKMDLLSENSPLIYMGEYLITYYCACAKCCDVETGITASGAHVEEGVTCAADKSIPFGTKLKIGDHVYTVQDRGGAIEGKHIDIYIDGHQRALQQDMGYKDVYMVVEP